MSWSSRRPGDDNIGPAAVANSSSANNTIVSPADEGYPPTSSRQLQNDEYVDEHDEFMFNNPLTAWTHMTRTLAHYDILEKIGEGTYGFVYRARCRDTNKFVALKKVRLSHAGLSGIPQQLVREIKILKRLRHVNLLRMIEVVTSKGVEYLEDTQPDNQSNNSNTNNNVQTMLTGSSTGNNKNENTKREKSTKTPELDKVQEARERYKGNLYIVLEYVEHDLVGLMDVAYQFTPVQVKCIFRQLLQGLAHMHEQKYIHRDIKSSNILLDSHFRLKLADFGLARSTEPPLLDRIRQSSVTVNGIPTQDFTNKVITLWYRPPEILVGATQYGPAVDIWSAGCILVELMMSGKPLFTGKTELEQLTLIWDMLGSPSASTWEYLSNMKKAKAGEVTIDISHHRSGRLRDKYTNKIPNVALNFLEKLLEWDPRKRLTATRALENRYFWTQPVAPDDPAELGTIQVGPGGHFHEFQTKKQRKQAKAIADQAKEKARHKGKSEEEVQAVFDKTYRSLMKKVAQEGLGVVTELQPIASEVHEKSQISMTAVAVAPLPQDQPTADLDKAPVEQFPTGDVDLDRRDRRNVDEPYDDRRHRRRRRREEGDDEDGEDRSRRRRHRGSRDRHDNEASYRARRREEKASSGRHRRSRDREGVDRRRDRTRDGAGHVKGLDGDDDRTFSHASLDLSFGETNGDTTMSEAVKSSNESVRNDQAAASPQQDRLSEEHESKTGTSNTSRWGERKSREKVVGNEVERVDESKQPEEKPNSKSQDVSGRVDDVPVESAKSDRSGVIEGGSHGRHNDRDPSRDERLDHGRNEDRRRNEREEGSLGRDDYKHRDREEPPHFRDDRRFGDRGGRGDYNDLSRRRDDNPDDRHMRHDGERRRGHHGRLRHHRHHHRSGRRSNV